MLFPVFSHVSSMALGMAMSINSSTPVVQIEIPQQLPSGFPSNLVQTVIACAHLWWCSDFPVVPSWGYEWNLLTTIGWLAIKFGLNIHVPYRMNDNFSDPLTFHLQNYNWKTGLWLHTCNTNDITTSLSRTLCLLLSIKCLQANMQNQDDGNAQA